MHENCTNIEVCREDVEYFDNIEAEDEIKYSLRDFMRWIYKQLETEYEYLTSQERFEEEIESNGWEFTEEGAIY